MKTGLCSITFRKLTVEQIIELAVKADLDGIEWGGDVHVPPGNLTYAEEVAKLTKDAGLDIVSYGSYYRAGCENEISFDHILATAVSLEAPAIRVWAGNSGSEETEEAFREKVVSDSRRIASLAENSGVAINYEYHGGTLTDNRESAAQLMKEINHHNVGIYWQPAVGQEADSRIQDIKEIKQWLSHVHVFHWLDRDRLPLSKGEQEWLRYFSLLTGSTEIRYAMLEFVKDNGEEQFLEDARTLHDLIDKCETGKSRLNSYKNL